MGPTTSSRSTRRMGWELRPCFMPMSMGARPHSSRPSRTFSRPRSSSKTKCGSNRWNRLSNKQLSRSKGHG